MAADVADELPAICAVLVSVVSGRFWARPSPGRRRRSGTHPLPESGSSGAEVPHRRPAFEATIRVATGRPHRQAAASPGTANPTSPVVARGEFEHVWGANARRGDESVEVRDGLDARQVPREIEGGALGRGHSKFADSHDLIGVDAFWRTTTLARPTTGSDQFHRVFSSTQLTPCRPAAARPATMLPGTQSAAAWVFTASVRGRRWRRRRRDAARCNSSAAGRG